MEEQKNRVTRVQRNKINKLSKRSAFFESFTRCKKHKHEKDKYILKEKDIITDTNIEWEVIDKSTYKNTRLMRNKTKKKVRNRKYKKIAVIVGTSAIFLYCIISFYFVNHFFFGSKINNINVSGKSIKSTEEEIKNNILNYSLVLEGRNDIIDKIEGSDINLKYNDQSTNQIQEFKNNQSFILWPLNIFKNKNYNLNHIISFDEKKLNEIIKSSNFFKEENIIDSKNPEFIYDEGSYKVTDGICGTKINEEILNNKLPEIIEKMQTTVRLEDLDCYEDPGYSKSSEKVIYTEDELNKYINTKITYIFGDNTEIIDGNIINKWLTVDNNLNINLNEDEIKNYIKNLCDKYTTAGKTRSFKTTSGIIKEVSGGNYGWIVDCSNEENELIQNIKDKKSLTKELSYSQEALVKGSYDIGDTYVEIDMSNQHLWFYKNGNLIVQGDIVTGNVNSGFSTPAGTYKLTYKQKDAVLVGENYRSPVAFWMPFNNNIGIHDASWRSAFGGNIYISNGSHGCVNVPYAVAKAIYENIEPNTPIVCYY